MAPGHVSGAVCIRRLLAEGQGNGGIMKKWKRTGAILGVILLLIAFCLPMVFALWGGENGGGMFRASLGGAFLLPVMAYVFSMVYRLLNNDGNKETGSQMKNIIFDVGQVLVKYDWEEYLKGFGFPEEEYQLMAENIFLSDTWNERDQGLLSEEEYVERFMDAIPQYREDVREVIKHTDQTISPMDYAYTWTKYLKSQGYHLYILSNYCQYTLDLTLPMMDFLENMDGVVFSCQVKQIKPHADIYQTLLSRYGLKAQECVFIDDREENCQAARELGISAIQFFDFKQAAKELEKLGIK